MATDDQGMHWGRFTFYVVFILFAIGVILAFGVGGLRPIQITQHSMRPGFEPGDFIFSFPQETYHRGDIVILDSPTGSGELLIKRIAGVPGDRLFVDAGCLFINGKYASEPYILEPMSYSIEELTVPEGEVFVLGDNRNESEDSSLWRIDATTGIAELMDSYDASGGQPGVWKRTVPISSIIGKASYRYLPFDRMGAIQSFPLTNVDGE
ncbi:MAG: signal peptidase I [Candidatus Hydrogenedentota bacterium]